MNYVVLSLFCSLSLCAVPFAYDTAALRAKEGDWNGALDQLKNLVTSFPDDASILYDTGVASFHVGDCTHAIAYFEQAAESTHDPLLQEKSLVNLGTAYAKTGDFNNAVPPLERALVLNPLNESARTKLEEFKKKRDEEQQKDSHDNTSNDGNTPEEQQKEEPSSENENKNSDSEGDDTPPDKDSSPSSDESNNTTKNKEQQKQDSRTNDASSESGAEQEQSSDDSDRNTQNERSNRPESNADQSPPGTDKAPQSSKDAEASTPPDTSSAGTPGKQEDAEQAKEMGEAVLDEALNKEENQWMRTLLERYEKHDIEGNKQLLRGRLQQRGAENACDKNW